MLTNVDLESVCPSPRGPRGKRLPDKKGDGPALTLGRKKEAKKGESRASYSEPLSWLRDNLEEMHKVRRVGHQRLGLSLLVGKFDQHGWFGVLENFYHHAPVAGADPNLLNVRRGF
jgi:hypothetical protein